MCSDEYIKENTVSLLTRNEHFKNHIGVKKVSPLEKPSLFLVFFFFFFLTLYIFLTEDLVKKYIQLEIQVFKNS